MTDNKVENDGKIEGRTKPRKTINIQKVTAEELNQLRLGGESWDGFFRAILPLIKQVRG